LKKGLSATATKLVAILIAVERVPRIVVEIA
jgi:hypothetical protein